MSNTQIRVLTNRIFVAHAKNVLSSVEFTTRLKKDKKACDVPTVYQFILIQAWLTWLLSHNICQRKFS